MRARRPIRHIYRTVESAATTAHWVVQVAYLGETFRKCFFDVSHGGEAGALKAARAWREGVLERVDPDVVDAHRRLVVRRNSRSGIPGVARYEPTGKDKRGPFWTAYWEEPGVGRRSAKFSVRLHGEKVARDLAIAARRTALIRLGLGDNLKQKPFVPPPAARRTST